MKTRINHIFLDIDGVLNSPGDEDLILDTVSKSKLKIFLKLVNKTKSMVCIISSRRVFEDERENISKIFSKIKKYLIFLSYKRTHLNRSDEIKDFINKYSINHFVILDDIDQGYSNDDKLKNRYIKINLEDGITKKNIKNAIKILNN